MSLTKKAEDAGDEMTAPSGWRMVGVAHRHPHGCEDPQPGCRHDHHRQEQDRVVVGGGVGSPVTSNANHHEPRRCGHRKPGNRPSAGTRRVPRKIRAAASTAILLDTLRFKRINHGRRVAGELPVPRSPTVSAGPRLKRALAYILRPRSNSCEGQGSTGYCQVLKDKGGCVRKAVP